MRDTAQGEPGAAIVGPDRATSSEPATAEGSATHAGDGRLDQVALGNPSYVWRFGQERRLEMIRRHLPLEGARVLDVGCGLGAYVRRFSEFTDRAYGIDIDPSRLKRGAEDGVRGLACAVSESLPFADAVFDGVLLNEVIEHVTNDRETLAESLRITRQGGKVFIFAPNRFYPFETHGVYLGKRYVFGNIPSSITCRTRFANAWSLTPAPTRGPGWSS